MHLSCHSLCRKSNPCYYLTLKPLKPGSFKEVLRGLPKFCFRLAPREENKHLALFDTLKVHHTGISKCGELSFRKLVGSVKDFGLASFLHAGSSLDLLANSMISKWKSYTKNLLSNASLYMLLWNLREKQFSHHPCWGFSCSGRYVQTLMPVHQSHSWCPLNQLFAQYCS